jgi:hypothetical protein
MCAYRPPKNFLPAARHPSCGDQAVPSFNRSSVGFWSRTAKAIILFAIGSAILVGILPAQGAEGPGYDDTPRLPNSPWLVHDRRRPQPPMVEAGKKPGAPPADAIILFDGKDLSQWRGGNPSGIENGCINILKTGEIRTKRSFGDCQFHIEWATPAVADGDLMNWGNSGVFFLAKREPPINGSLSNATDGHELQIIESHDSKIYADGIAGAIYGQTPPLLNAARRPGQWQAFDVVFTAPQFKGKKLVQPAYFTVFWNGVLVQYHTASLGPSMHRTLATYDSQETSGPIRLQEHHSAVRFRNIWVRPLKLNP